MSHEAASRQHCLQVLFIIPKFSCRYRSYSSSPFLSVLLCACVRDFLCIWVYVCPSARGGQGTASGGVFQELSIFLLFVFLVAYMCLVCTYASVFPCVCVNMCQCVCMHKHMFAHSCRSQRLLIPGVFLNCSSPLN